MSKQPHDEKSNIRSIHSNNLPGELRREVLTSETSSDSYSGGGGSDEESHPVAEALRILVVHRKLIFAIALTLLAMVVFHSLTTTPMYTATASVSISSYSPSLQGSSIESSFTRQSEKQNYLDTQIQLFTRLTLGDKVLSDPQIGPSIKTYLSQGGGFLDSLISFIRDIFTSKTDDRSLTQSSSSQEAYSNDIGLIKGYLSLVSIRPVKGTFLVDVNVTTSDATLSANIANAHTLNFIQLSKDEKRGSALENLLFLKSQASDLAEKVAQVEQDLAQYAEENAIIALSEDENIVLKNMSEINALYTAASNKRISSEAILNEVKKNGGDVNSGSSSAALEGLRTKLRDAEGEYADLSQKFKPSYPAMRQLQAKINSIKGDLKSQQSIILKTAQAQFDTDLAAEKELERQLEIQKSKAFDLSRKSVKYNTLKREYDSLRDLHQTVLRQLKEVQISSESDTANIFLADRAAVPQSTSSPRTKRNIILSLLIGPLLGFGIAFLLEILNNTIETGEQIEQILRLPSLGLIPAFDLNNPDSQPEALRKLITKTPRGALGYETQQSKGEEPSNTTPEVSNTLGEQTKTPTLGLVTLDSPFSATSEAFRAVRTSILLSSADSPPRAVLVTSTRKGEGKTTLSSNLALTIAGTVKSAVIVDCDLRRSALHRMFQIPQDSPGLVNHLTGINTLDDVIYPTSHEKLSIIPAGIKPPNPAELLGSNKMRELIEELKERFEFVLIDSPPILPVTDSVLLSRIVDGVVFVVRGQQTEQNIIKEAKNRIQQVGGKILGVVLNGVDVKRGQQYYYYRDAYSEYYDEEHSEKKRANYKFWS